MLERNQRTKKIQSYNLSRSIIAKLDKFSYNLTRTKRGKSGVIEAMIEFAIDNEKEFSGHFKGDIE